MPWTYDSQPYTGWAVSTQDKGRWNRGVLYRAAMPVLHLPPRAVQRDPSDPTTWPGAFVK